MMSNSKRREIIILILCLLIGFALRYYHLDQKSLWVDEIHTYNDSRDGFNGQINFYRANPTYLHPPLFFLLTHLFYPFEKPERDLRIIPLIVGTISILMIYLLAKSFSSLIPIPCMVSLTFMAYHISISQDGRSYALLMLLGMLSLYFLVQYLKTSEKKYVVVTALFNALLFYTSYSSILFILFSQILWFYKPENRKKTPSFSSFLIQNTFTLLFILPWIIFISLNYKGQTFMDPKHQEGIGSFWSFLYGILHDWTPFFPLMIISIFLFIFFTFLTKEKRNSSILLGVFIIPIIGLYFYCKLLHITHFITSRYLITFLPLFIIILFLSLVTIESRFERIKQYLRLKLLFLILFIASNLVILPLYYRCQKQDYYGLVAYLKEFLRDGDQIFVDTQAHMPAILHYFEVYPRNRHHVAKSWKDSNNSTVYKVSFSYQNKNISLLNSRTCCSQYVQDGNRLWIVVGKWIAKDLKQNSPSVLKGYFDGSFLNFNRFPTDASMYLFLWDPESPNEKGIDMPIN